MTHNHRFIFVLVLPVLLISACDDDGPTVVDRPRGVDAAGGRGGAGGTGGTLPLDDSAVSDQGVIDGAIRLDIGEPDTAVDQGPPSAECEPSETRCLADTPGVWQTCIGGRWSIQQCPNETVCFDGRCIRDPDGCEIGERICLTAEQPATCNPGQPWQVLAPCDEGSICINGRCERRGCAEAIQSRSYLGCEYLTADLPNGAFIPSPQSTADAPVGVVLANPDPDNSVRVTITSPNGEPAPLVAMRRIGVPDNADFNLMPQTVTSEIRDAAGEVVMAGVMRADGIELPPAGLGTFLFNNDGAPPRTSTIKRTAYRIVTDSPVAAYQFSPYCCNYSFSNDASLLFPTNTWGLEYRYLGIPSADAVQSIPGSMVIIATEDGTEVNVRYARPDSGKADPTGRIRVNPMGASARLSANELMILQTNEPAPFTFNMPRDLSGSTISSNKPVAVFSTHLCTNYPRTMGACDHVQEQLFPTGTWGSSFVLVPPERRGRAPTEVIYWKILAQNDGAQVRLSVPFANLNPVRPGYENVPYCGDLLSDQQTITLRAPGYCEFGTQRPVQIDGDDTLMVMGIISGQESTGELMFGSHAGDPAIFLVPPDRQYLRSYTFLAPDTYFSDYLTIVVDPESEVTLDGAVVDLSDLIEVPGSARAYKHIPITDGPHRVESNRPFGILVVAFDDFVSYAFTGGLNLSKR